MSSNYRPQGPEKITNADEQLSRMKTIAGIGQKSVVNEQHKLNTNFSTVLHEATAADGKTYGLIQEGFKVHIKCLMNERYEYLTGDEKDYAYKDYATAFKHMNLLFKDISSRNEYSAPINIFEGGLNEKKNLIDERFVLKAPAAAPPAAPAPMPPSGNAGSPLDVAPEGGAGAPPMDNPDSGALGNEFDSAENQLGGDQDPAKAIQKLTGKLTQLMRTADDQIMTSEFQKGILNSVISAVKLETMEDNDLLSVIKKLKGEDNPESAGGQPNNTEFTDDQGVDYNTNVPEPADLAPEQPLKEIDIASPEAFAVGDYVELNRPVATFRETFLKGLKGYVRAVSDNNALWLDLDDGREIGWINTKFVTKIKTDKTSQSLEEYDIEAPESPENQEDPNYYDPQPSNKPSALKGVGKIENIDLESLFGTLQHNTDVLNGRIDDITYGVNDITDYDGLLSNEELNILVDAGVIEIENSVPILPTEYNRFDIFQNIAKQAFENPSSQMSASSNNSSEAPYLRGNEPMSESEEKNINEEIFTGDQPTFDDGTMPNIVQNVVSNIGVDLNQANENDVVQAVKLFTQTYSSDQNQTGFMKQLSDFAEKYATDTTVAGINLSYSALSPLGQQVFDQLEIVDPSMGQLDYDKGSNSAQSSNTKSAFMGATSASPALAAESTAYMKNIIMEVLNKQ